MAIEIQAILINFTAPLASGIQLTAKKLLAMTKEIAAAL